MRVLAIGLVCLVGCQPKTSPAGPDPKTAASPAPAVESAAPVQTAVDAEAARSLMDRIAKGYSWLARADGLYWAPWDCKAPPPPPTFASAATDGEHARKLYHLRMQSPEAYVSATGSTLPSQVGIPVQGRDAGPWLKFAGPPDASAPEWSVFAETDQVLVKESYFPHECTDDSIRAVKMSGKTFCLDQPGALFVMARPRAAKTATDDGWIYGTISGGTVTSSGLVASCMGCHQKAPHGRMFGLPK